MLKDMTLTGEKFVIRHR